MYGIVMVMLPYLTGFALVSIAIELLLYQTYVWRFRKAAAIFLIATLPAASGAVAALDPSVFSVVFVLVSAARVFNLLRLVEGRNSEPYLRSTARRASIYFSAGHAITLLLSGLQIAMGSILLVVAGMQLVIAVVLLLSTARSLRKSHPATLAAYYADRDLPTVSVLVPARNETEDLEACLHSILASNYPKLEVVVLDDCSRDKTPDIIRSFAQDGVRFISGTEPNKSWLAKNYAYQQLADASTGDLLLFCGVDTRFGRDTIRSLVTTMLARNKRMISVMPKRISGGVYAAFIQPMRYWWELALPRRYFNRPPVLSTCWIVATETLQELGSFSGAKRSIIPEMLFARQLARSDAYSFVRAEGELELTTRKSWREQRDTAIRVRYPQVHRRPELAIGLALLELMFLFGPFAALVVGLLLGTFPVVVLAAAAAALLIITHVIIMTVSDPGNVPLALVNFPLVVLAEVGLGLVSMAKYEFSVVEWKGRNVCIPVMQIIPRLPKP